MIHKQFDVCKISRRVKQSTIALLVGQIEAMCITEEQVSHIN